MSLVADLALPLYLHWTADAIRTAVVKKGYVHLIISMKKSVEWLL